MTFLLVTEGAGDRVLVPIVNALLGDLGVEGKCIHGGGYTRYGSGLTLGDRIRRALHDLPSDVVLVHRDCDNARREHRESEIRSAAMLAESSHAVVVVIPIRMTEAWLLADERAIRIAAGNARGTALLRMPRPQDVEEVPDPKEVLREALRLACGLSGRRLDRFDVNKAVHAVPVCLDSLEGPRRLPGFRAFESALRRAHAAGWRPGFYA